MGLHRFQPPADLPSHVLHGRLCLEDFRLVRELEFQAQPQLEHARFLMGACPDEVTCFEWLRCVLRHDEFRKTIENAAFEALPDGVPPVFFHLPRGPDDMLEQIVGAVDYGKRVHTDRYVGDNVDQGILLSLLKGRVSDGRTCSLVDEVIRSYDSVGGMRERERERVRSCGEEFPSETSRARFLRTSICMSWTAS